MTVRQESPRGGSIRGIKEASMQPSVRELSLYNAAGERLAALSIPDHNLSPRVVESLNAILVEIERHQGADPMVELARGLRDKGLTDSLEEIGERYPHVLAEIECDRRPVTAN